jgi:hypothetical protein
MFLQLNVILSYSFQVMVTAECYEPLRDGTIQGRFLI